MFDKMWKSFVVTLLCVALPQETFAQFRGSEWIPTPNPTLMAGGGGIGWFWGILLFALWFGIMVLIFLLIRFLGLSISTKTRSLSATEDWVVDILKRRYANGEIGKEEFEQKRKDLGV